MKANIVLFGATGYTGHLAAEAMVQRGLRPVLCGRNQDKLNRQAADLGGLEIALADVNDETALAGRLSEGDILVSTVGPFVQYGHAAIEAAVRKGAVYLDSTGEPAFIQAVFETFGPRAQNTGATLLTACGYDYIPGNCAAGVALNAAGPGAVRVDIGYFSRKHGRIGPLDMSQGTRASLRRAMVDPIKVWRDGTLVAETGGIHVRRFRIDEMEHPGLTVSSTEHFSLPRVYPDLREINTYLGWFGKATYMMQQAARFQSWMSMIPGYRSMARWSLSLLPTGGGKGPDAWQRKQNISHIIAEAFDGQGRILSRAELVGADGYTFTANFLAWAADMTLQGKVSKAGALGPIEAFGLDLLHAGCEQSGLKLIVRPEHLHTAPPQ